MTDPVPPARRDKEALERSPSTPAPPEVIVAEDRLLRAIYAGQPAPYMEMVHALRDAQHAATMEHLAARESAAFARGRAEGEREAHLWLTKYNELRAAVEANTAAARQEGRATAIEDAMKAVPEDEVEAKLAEIQTHKMGGVKHA